jgi:ATP-dependent DNA ligase
MLLRNSSARHSSGFVEPCRPSKAIRPPSGPQWVHEIKHDGFRLVVRREGVQVRCLARGGHDWAERFPAIVDAPRRFKVKSFLIDGEAVVCCPDGLSDFDALRVGRRAHEVTLAAFDLIELTSRFRNVSSASPRYWAMALRLSSTTSTWSRMVRPYSSTPVGWVWRALFRSG